MIKLRDAADGAERHQDHPGGQQVNDPHEESPPSPGPPRRRRGGLPCRAACWPPRPRRGAADTGAGAAAGAGSGRPAGKAPSWAAGTPGLPGLPGIRPAQGAGSSSRCGVTPSAGSGPYVRAAPTGARCSGRGAKPESYRGSVAAPYPGSGSEPNGDPPAPVAATEPARTSSPSSARAPPAFTPAGSTCGRRLRRADRAPSARSPRAPSARSPRAPSARARRRPAGGIAPASGAASAAAGAATEDLEPGRASTNAASRAAASPPRLRFLAVSLRVMTRRPPPAGSTKPCAQPSTGASVVSGLPPRVADQPPAASASTSVPEVPGATAAVAPTGPDGTGTAAPPGVRTRTRATGPDTCHRS